MAAIVENIQSLNFLTSSLCIIFLDGKILSVTKINGWECHIEYVHFLFKKDKRVRELLKDVDFKYYFQNPSCFLNDLVPIFNESGCVVYMNLNPNTTKPSNAAVILLPEVRTKAIDKTLTKVKEKFLPICFYDAIVYSSIDKDFSSFMPDNIHFDVPNSHILYEKLESEMQEVINKVKSIS